MRLHPPPTPYVDADTWQYGPTAPGCRLLGLLVGAFGTFPLIVFAGLNWVLGVKIVIGGIVGLVVVGILVDLLAREGVLLDRKRREVVHLFRIGPWRRLTRTPFDEVRAVRVEWSCATHKERGTMTTCWVKLGEGGPAVGNHSDLESARDQAEKIAEWAGLKVDVVNAP